MNMDLENELPLKSYLLGDLSLDEQQRLEQRLMIDSDAFEHLCWIEDELIEDYLEGGLTGRDKERFENFFLATSERRQKLSFAKSLKRYVAENRLEKSSQGFWPKVSQALWPNRNPVLKWALAASLMLVVAGGSWSALQISRLQVALDREQTNSLESQSRLKQLESDNSRLAASLENEQTQLKQVTQEMANLQKAQKPGSFLLPGQNLTTTIAISLVPLMRGADNSPKISIPPGTNLVRLNVHVEAQDFTRYRATLQRIGEDKIIAQTELSMQGLLPGLFIPAELMTPEDYVLKLSGITAAGDIESIRSYYFRVLPR